MQITSRLDTAKPYSDPVTVFNVLNNRVKELAVSRFTIEVIKILPKLYPRTLDEINFKINENNVTIICEHKDRKGRILNPQNQPRALVVPRYIEINETFGEILGLYYGDGTKDDLSCVEFSNSCPELITFWKNYLHNFDIDDTDFIYKIKVSENVKLKYGLEEKEIIDYWRQSLNILQEKDIRLMWVKTRHEPSTYLSKFGTFVLVYHDSMFSFFFNALIDNILIFLVMNEKFRIGFIRGLIAAEGNINLRKNGSLSLVRIAGNKTRRRLYSLILWKFFRIEAQDDNYTNQIYVGGYSRLNKIKELNLHFLHPIKREKFENGYLKLVNNKNRKHDDNMFLRNKKAIEILRNLETRPLRNNEIKNTLGISTKYVDFIINGYRRRKAGYKYNGLKEIGLIKKERVDGVLKWKLTEKGQIFLKDLVMNYNQ